MSQLGTDSPPPVSSDFNVPVEPPAWPKVVGIISIVLASLSLVCGGCGMVFLVFMGKFLAMAEQQMGPVPSVMLPGTGMIVMTALGWLWAFMLLGAGIMTLKRRSAGKLLHLVYAGVSIVLTIVSTIINIQYQSAIHEWVVNNSSSQWAKSQNPAGQYIGMCIGLLIGLGYPVFLLIWFGLVKRRPEDMGQLPEEPLV